MKLLNSEIEFGPDSSMRQLPNRAIGKLLVEAGRLKPEQVERIADAQKAFGMRFGEAGVKLGLLTEVDVKLVLSSQYGYTYLRPDQGNFSPELVTAYQPFTPQAEAIRKLRTELLLRWFNSARKQLALVSVDEGDGRSYLAANLAIAFAQLGESTLLVDGDMRAPRLHKMFNCDDGLGLSSVLSGRTDSYLDGVIPVLALPGLFVLPAGPIPPNPLELLGQSSFSLLLAYLSERFEIIIVDTPSAAANADAQVIGARVGGALLLTRKNITRTKELKKLTDAFAASGTPIVGTIMNNR